MSDGSRKELSGQASRLRTRRTEEAEAHGDSQRPSTTGRKASRVTEAVATRDRDICVCVCSVGEGLERGADGVTETQTIYAFLEMFRSEVGFPKRMATEACGSSHPLQESRGQLEPTEESGHGSASWGWSLIPGLPPILRFFLERTRQRLWPKV